MRCGLATCPHGSASLACGDGCDLCYSRSQPSQGKNWKLLYPERSGAPGAGTLNYRHSHLPTWLQNRSTGGERSGLRMITRYTPPFRTTIPPQWRGACAAVAGGGAEPRHRDCRGPPCVRGFGLSRASTALRMISSHRRHRHMNELATLEFGLQQLARLEDELAPDGALPGRLVLALSSRTRIGTVERANAIAAATLQAEAQRRLTIMPIEIATGYRRPDGQWPSSASGARTGCSRTASATSSSPTQALRARDRGQAPAPRQFGRRSAWRWRAAGSATTYRRPSGLLAPSERAAARRR